jgi:non-ribosomal peptide synthetase component F
MSNAANYRMDERLVSGARVWRSATCGSSMTDTRHPGGYPGRRSLEISHDAPASMPGRARCGHVEHLLAQVHEDLDRPVAAFEIVTPAERSQLFNEFNATRAPLDPSKTAVDMWNAQVAATPDAVALECEGVRLSFREVNEWTNRLARSSSCWHRRRRRSGPTRSSRSRSDAPSVAAAILAIWKCGAAYVPIDPDYPSERIRQVFDTASPSLVLRDAATLDERLEAAFADRSRSRRSTS